jgi:hypothetical protein
MSRQAKTRDVAVHALRAAKQADSAKKSPIRVEDVSTATPIAVADLDESFFRVRFDRLTPSEKRYLRAMAGLGPGPHRSGDIAELLGRKVTTVAPLRATLLAKGMVWSPNHGDTANRFRCSTSSCAEQCPSTRRCKGKGASRHRRREVALAKYAQRGIVGEHDRRSSDHRTHAPRIVRNTRRSSADCSIKQSGRSRSVGRTWQNSPDHRNRSSSTCDTNHSSRGPGTPVPTPFVLAGRA